MYFGGENVLTFSITHVASAGGGKKSVLFSGKLVKGRNGDIHKDR